jgi:hypothetical protein
MYRWSLLTLALLLVACSHDSAVAPDANLNLISVKYGTYFGMCSGYCVTEMTIDSSAIVLDRSSWNSTKFPDREERRATSGAEWSGLAAAANIDAIAPLDSIIGCPDCDDSGGEWIEVRRGDRVKRVLFEYGDTVRAIQDLVERARAIRASFKD